MPDMLRTKHLQLGLVMDQLVAQQRAKCVSSAWRHDVPRGSGCRWVHLRISPAHTPLIDTLRPLRMLHVQCERLLFHLGDWHMSLVSCRLLVLQEILPLSLSPVRGEVPSAAASASRGSGFWKRPPQPPQGSGRSPQRPVVAVKQLRLPEGLSRVGCDTGQVVTLCTESGTWLE